MLCSCAFRVEQSLFWHLYKLNIRFYNTNALHDQNDANMLFQNQVHYSSVVKASTPRVSVSPTRCGNMAAGILVRFNTDDKGDKLTNPIVKRIICSWIITFFRVQFTISSRHCCACSLVKFITCLYYKHVFCLKPHSSVFLHFYDISYFSEEYCWWALSIFFFFDNLILYTSLKKCKLLLNILKKWIKNWLIDRLLHLYLGPNRGHWYLVLHKCFSNSTESTILNRL